MVGDDRAGSARDQAEAGSRTDSGDGRDAAERADRARWHAWGEPPGNRTLAERLPDSARQFLRREIGLPEDARRLRPVPLEEMRLRPGRLSDEVRSRLAAVAEVREDRVDRVAHAGGKSYRDLVRRRSGDAENAPDAVVLPEDAAGVAEVLRVCSEAGVAVVPFGGGTSVVGGVEPLSDGFAAVISLDLSKLDTVVGLDPEAQIAVLQPGMRGPDAESALRLAGFTLGHFPQSYEQASIGGYVATRSAGQASTGFGRSDDLVISLRAATPAGELVLGRVPRSAAGPDLRQLVIGGEGAFGVVTEVGLRVRPVPAEQRYEGWFFPSFSHGVGAFRRLVQSGAAADVCRLSDEDETRAGLALSGHDRGLGARLLRWTGRRCLVVLGWEGDATQIAMRRWAAAKSMRQSGGSYVGRGAGRSWQSGRFAAPYLRDDLLDLGVLVETLETAASWSKLAEVHRSVRAALHDALAGRGGTALVLCHVSHLYTTGASLYFTVLARQESETEAALAQWDAAKSAATNALLQAGGTLSHHHGIGADHRPWLSEEIGDLGVDVLRSVKASLDPAGILNPGKLVP